MSGKRSPRRSSLYTPSCSSLDSLRIDLNSFSFDTICHTGLILLIFGCFYFFLELFFVKFILNFNNEHVQNHSCHSSTSAFRSHGENYIRWVVYVTLNNGNSPLAVAPGQPKTHAIMRLSTFVVTLCIAGDLHKKLIFAWGDLSG